MENTVITEVNTNRGNLKSVGTMFGVCVTLIFAGIGLIDTGKAAVTRLQKRKADKLSKQNLQEQNPQNSIENVEG